MNTSAALPTTNTLGTITDRAHQVVDRTAAVATPALERAATGAHRTIDKAAEAATPAANWVDANGRQLAHRTTELTEACSGYVRERPLVAVAGALAVGYFIGKLMR
ncbi:MAG: hypothetical protein ABI777_07755 [Betaproteobacteria bacterium]